MVGRCEVLNIKSCTGPTNGGLPGLGLGEELLALEKYNLTNIICLQNMI
jgi:hypothetical protein